MRRRVFKTRTFSRWSRKAALQMTAEALLELDLLSLGRALRAGELMEICDEEEPHTG